MSKLLTGLFIIIFFHVSHAGDVFFSQENDVIDLGLLQPTIVNGTVVPESWADLRAIIPQIEILDRSEAVATENYCTGLLIAPDVVLTAAHCVDAEPQDLEIKVHFGDHAVGAVGFVAHPEYEELQIRESSHGKVKVRGGYNDVALIFLAESVKFVPALLPAPGYRLQPGQRAFLAGYGRLGVNVPNAEKELHYAEVEVYEASKGRLSVKGPKTSCHGDSGGPLLIRLNRRWLSVGLTSFGNCLDDATPMRTSFYTDWILEQIQDFRSQRTTTI